ncbi:unnamed protein product [Sphagnum jensenii]|uniref:Uncharacterized protein n=1 Tax=Sphagnum jensenii TaxID=128206 RepID=A0ABP1B246_9BRYO
MVTSQHNFPAALVRFECSTKPPITGRVIATVTRIAGYRSDDGTSRPPGFGVSSGFGTQKLAVPVSSRWWDLNRRCS